MTASNEVVDAAAKASEPNATYVYADEVRHDVLRMFPPDGKVIGTIGCGQAATEAYLVRQGRQCHGVDVSEKAIAVAKQRLTSARVIAPDDITPFAPSSLDGLVLADVIEHLPRAWEALASFSKMVRPGGWVVISVPNMRYIEALNELVVKGDWPEYPQGIFDETHIQVMTHKRLERWAQSSGLYVEKWFDAYDWRFLQRNVYRVLDYATLRLAHRLLVASIQVRLRRKA